MSGSNVDIFIKDYINLNQKNVMYNSDEDDSRRNYRIPESKSQKAVRTIFGIVMILLINFFNWTANWAWTRYVVGIVLIIYGFWRAYRQYKGIDSRL